jgi:hypothetical protein
MNAKPALGPLLKWPVLVCLMLLTTPAIFAQNETDANGQIEILKLHWQKLMRPPRNFDPSVVSTAGAFRDPYTMTNATSSSAMETSRNVSSIQTPPPTAGSAFPATPARMPIFYAYSIKIRNDSAKTIEALAWDYVFVDKASGAELGRHEFLSYQKIGAGKAGTFNSELRSPPTRIVSAANAPEKRPKFTEHAAVRCVLYADNSTWHSASATPDICNQLAKARPVKHSRQN